jgi:hypothetical protein
VCFLFVYVLGGRDLNSSKNESFEDDRFFSGVVVGISMEVSVGMKFLFN